MYIYKNFLRSFIKNKKKVFVNLEDKKYTYDFVFQKILIL